MAKNVSQSQLILEYYKARPNEAISHQDAVDWAVAEWAKRTGGVFRDPDRAVRKWSQVGVLIKISKGVYMYDPEHQVREDLYDFTPQQKQAILQRDNYRCVVCGRGKADGVELQIDHVKPKDAGGKNTIENGETLCGQHNFIKKNYSQREAGKRYFINMQRQAVIAEDKEMLSFCDEVLAVYDRYGYDSHI